MKVISCATPLILHILRPLSLSLVAPSRGLRTKMLTCTNSSVSEHDKSVEDLREESENLCVCVCVCACVCVCVCVCVCELSIFALI